jgi:hypothetical protein
MRERPLRIANEKVPFCVAKSEEAAPARGFDSASSRKRISNSINGVTKCSTRNSKNVCQNLNDHCCEELV